MGGVELDRADRERINTLAGIGLSGVWIDFKLQTHDALFTGIK
jgi:hypothetical protein